MDPTQQAMISALRSIRDQADSVLKSIEQSQSVPLYKAFHEACCVGSRWQMSAV
jgi:hypothetical protein